MKKLIKTIVLASALVIVLGLTAFPALAIEVPDVVGLPKGDISEVITRITNWALGIAGGIAVLFIIYGGIRYVTSSGSQTHMEAAKNIMSKAILGLVIIVAAWIIVTAVLSAFGNPD